MNILANCANTKLIQYRKVQYFIGLVFLLIFVGGPVAAQQQDYTVSYSLPECNTSNSKVKIISSNADWKDINSSQYNIFCVKPGDYTGAGLISITADGTSSSRRYIRYMSSNDGGEAPWNQAADQRAIVEGLHLTGASWWVISRITVTDPDFNSGLRYMLSLRENSDNNIIANVLVEKTPKSASYVGKGSDNNTFYANVFRTTQISSTESHCMFVNAGTEGDASSLQNVKNLKIIDNEFYNCAGDAIQFWTSNKENPSGDIAGLVVHGNDFYVTPDMYTNCTGSFSKSGMCSCSEGALDLKIGVKSSSPSTSERLVINDNRMWGFRQADSSAKCSSLSDPGYAVALHKTESDFADIIGNFIFDSSSGVYTAGSADNVQVKSNLFYQVNSNQTGGKRGVLELGGKVGEISNNVVIESNIYLKADGDNYTIQNNHFLNAGDWKTRNNGDLTTNSKVIDNYFYNTQPYDGNAVTQGNIVNASAEGVGQTHCFKIKRLTNPTNVCIDNADIPGAIGFGGSPPMPPSDLTVQ